MCIYTRNSCLHDIPKSGVYTPDAYADTRQGKQRMVMQTHNKLCHQNRLFLQVFIDATDGVNILDEPSSVKQHADQ